MANACQFLVLLCTDRQKSGQSILTELQLNFIEFEFNFDQGI